MRRSTRSKSAPSWCTAAPNKTSINQVESTSTDKPDAVMKSTSKSEALSSEVRFLEDKPLPTPPSRVHGLRHSTALYGHRTKSLVQKTEGYHFGIRFCAVTTAIVFLINCIVTVWAAMKYKIQGGLGTIQEGSCNQTKHLAMWLHLAINVLSTFLLGCSNYTMQCLSSPTRKDIDKSHLRGFWLDIGIPSIRNLTKIAKPRLLLWIMVATSSIPLHLMYNSAVFSTLCARQYSVFLVTDSFLTGAAFNVTWEQYSIFGTSEYSSQDFVPLSYQLENLRHMQSSLQRLDNVACKKAYSAGFISSRADVLLVSSKKNDTNSLLGFDPLLSPGFSPNNPGHRGGWTSAREPAQKMSGNAWTAYGLEIDYCLSQLVNEQCRLQYSVAILIIVIICNFVKMICMCLIALQQPSEPLVTLGDAIASFLDKPDSTTRGQCLAGNLRLERKENWHATASPWDSKKQVWFAAASQQRWYLCKIL